MENLVVAGQIQSAVAKTLSMRCPRCKHDVSFQSIGFDDAEFFVGHGGLEDLRHTGQRRCGNPRCRAHLFVVLGGGEIAATYPPEVIDFDASGLPDRVVAALDEAVRCHAAGCYVASAIMVRKTLEEVCADRGAGGKDLYQRIEALSNSVVLPPAFLPALHDLRLLGNDAAHLESRTYDSVGKTELEVAIDVTKEILKATYQYDSLMSRLADLKREREEG